MIIHALVGISDPILTLCFLLACLPKLPTYLRSGGDLNAQLKTTKPHSLISCAMQLFIATFQPRFYLEGEIKILLFRFIRKEVSVNTDEPLLERTALKLIKF